MFVDSQDLAYICKISAIKFLLEKRKSFAEAKPYLSIKRS